MSDELNYLVWSAEHNAWWAPNGWGYVRTVAEAGRFTEKRAREIVKRAQPGHESAIPIECVVGIGLGEIRCLECGKPYDEPPANWDCPECGGPVSQKMGEIHVPRQS